MPVDPYFRVVTLTATPQPQTVTWLAMHQDYSEEFVANEKTPTESEAGRSVVKHLLAGERGHYGPLEHPQITVNAGWFPHSVMQQARTHRIASFDVQSGRYTGQRIIQAAQRQRDLEEVFYLRPVGTYRNRQGKSYSYTKEQRLQDLAVCDAAAQRYAAQIADGRSEEHARELIPYAIRQHFVVSVNLRSALHFMDLRAKKDAQWEIQQFCDLLWPHVIEWVPEVAGWYSEHRLHKARLAP
jgi:thymidylate synthase (FAD)